MLCLSPSTPLQPTVLRSEGPLRPDTQSGQNSSMQLIVRTGFYPSEPYRCNPLLGNGGPHFCRRTQTKLAMNSDTTFLTQKLWSPRYLGDHRPTRGRRLNLPRAPLILPYSQWMGMKSAPALPRCIRCRPMAPKLRSDPVRARNEALAPTNVGRNNSPSGKHPLVGHHPPSPPPPLSLS